ncbi:MAG: helix-turn-helix domain-containing protein [Kiritimatiellaeota bacterium]|nr:helix-turn-helix domain-containing protein [Kiritimatiellota bacterium]
MAKSPFNRSGRRAQPRRLAADDASHTARRLRDLRQRCRLSMRQLAHQADVAPSYVSGVEAGRISPTLATLRKLLMALGTDLGAFFSKTATPPTGPIFRREAMRIVADGKRCYTLILPSRPDIRLLMLDEEFEPGERPPFETLAGDLAGYVLMGELLLEVQGEPACTLRTGDAFYIPAWKKVRGRTLRQTPVRLVTAQILTTEKTRTARS